VQTERSEVGTHERGQDSPIQTDLARLIRCLLCGKEENFNSSNVTGLLANGDELNLSLPKFARPLYFFLSSDFLALP